jgi:hypothetical protein
MSTKPPIFIGGAGRAGTRLLRSIIGKIPSIFEIPRETYIFSPKQKTGAKILKQIDSKNNQQDKQKALLMFVLLSIFYKQEIAYKKFLSLKNDYENALKIWSGLPQKNNNDKKIISLFQKIYPLINSLTDNSYCEKESYSSNRFAIFDFVVNCLCEENNCLRWVEKTPANIFQIEKILEYYPPAKFIAITRNPYAVYASWKKKDKNKNIISVIKNWLEINQAIINNKNHNNFFALRYEDLITNPEQTIKSICEFIDEPFSPQLLDVEVLNTNSQARGAKGFNQDSINKWKDELNFIEKLIIEIPTKRLALQCGYN